MSYRAIRIWSAASLLPAVLLLGCGTTNLVPYADGSLLADAGSGSTAGARPIQAQVPPDQLPSRPVSPRPSIDAIAVPAVVDEPPATYILDQSPESQRIRPVETPGPAAVKKRGRGVPVGDELLNRIQLELNPQPLSWEGSSLPFDAANFDTNITTTGGSVFIPPDPIAAAGPEHLVNVVNVTVQFFQKDGTNTLEQSLKSFFSALSPLTFTFDPKVIYDQFAERFVLVTLEQTDTAVNDPADTSRIFMAVSDDADPNGTWYVTAIDATTNTGLTGYWADYPGLAVGEEAVYVTNNMFGFGGGGFGGVRLWVIDKGLTSGFYAGGAATVRVFDPYASVPGDAATTQPAHIFGTPPAGVGTFLVSYSGFTGGGDEFVQVVRIDDPLGTPTFTRQFVNIGDVEDLTTPLPDAPQSGTGTLVDTNDRRALHAVWREDTLWMTTTINPKSGDPDHNQATAYWVELDTSLPSSPTVTDQGGIGGEDIAGNTHTFFPSVAVNSAQDLVIGFAASAPSIYPGAYFTTRELGDPAGTTGPSQVVREGTAYYVRTLGGPSNRWGDYSGTAVDPADQCFWVYNEYAMARGTQILGEDGRWSTAYVRTCACSETLDLAAGQWALVSLACDVGEANTVRKVFGDDLDPAGYGTTWAVFKRDEVNDSYVQLSLDDTINPLEEGRGYWIKTLETGKAVTVEGTHSGGVDVPLIADSDGRYNMVGAPFTSPVAWADARVIDGANVLTLDEADPGGVCQTPPYDGCIMSRVMHKWNGSAYQAFDGETPGAEGTLIAFDGFWVKAFKDDIALRLPDPAAVAAAAVSSRASTSAKAQAKGADPEQGDLADAKGSRRPSLSSAESWFLRLIVDSGELQDPGNLLGQLPDSHRGYDAHDLKELPPFGDPYLTIVFPHADWDTQAGDYTTDFHGSARRDQWSFEVRASAEVEVATLRWEGEERLFRRAWLVDEETGRRYKMRPGGNFELDLTGGARRFRVEVIIRP